MKANNDEKTGEKGKWKETEGRRSGPRLLEKIDGVNIRLAIGNCRRREEILVAVPRGTYFVRFEFNTLMSYETRRKIIIDNFRLS